ncbi:MAG TPA: alpha/beta fold hydrolase [Bacteroidia bacterium]|jgi:pimeloyl-ACP methyl ester carboxylesterase|nr:alpha/beta fold hydrolase [Bacteroidia bacterium]
MQHLLLLHGALGAADQFQPLIAALSNTHHIHAINFYGHGGETNIEAFTIETFADQVLTYLQRNNIDKANIAGYSMGGYVALYLAKKHPEKVNKIFTLATKFLWTPAIAEQEIKLLNPEKMAEKLPAFAQTLEKRHAPNDWKMLLNKTAKMMIGLGNHSPLTSADLQKIDVPVLISTGDKDNMVTLEETIAAYRQLKKANLLVLPATAHPIEKVNIARLASEMELFFRQPVVA